MINLLPDNEKREIRAARTNVLLLRYNFLLVVVAALLLAGCGIVYAALSAGKATAEETNRSNISRASEFASTKKQADEYRQNLETAKKILNNEVIYTDLAFSITKLLPAGVVLDNLTLSSSDFGTQTTLSAHGKDYDAATAMKAAFEASNLFSDVHFQTITLGDTAGTGYPIGITINVTINKATQQ